MCWGNYLLRTNVIVSLDNIFMCSVLTFPPANRSTHVNSSPNSIYSPNDTHGLCKIQRIWKEPHDVNNFSINKTTSTLLPPCCFFQTVTVARHNDNLEMRKFKLEYWHFPIPSENIPVGSPKMCNTDAIQHRSYVQIIKRERRLKQIQIIFSTRFKIWIYGILQQ